MDNMLQSETGQTSTILRSSGSYQVWACHGHQKGILETLVFTLTQKTTAATDDGDEDSDDAGDEEDDDDCDDGGGGGMVVVVMWRW